MNKFFKLTPVVAAAIALVGCSNDDFFGGANEGVNSNLPSIAVSVEAPTISRANLYETGVAANPLVFDWVDGDELRVYDAAVQKYDNFAWATSKFVLNNASDKQFVETYVGATEAENAYALYSGGNSYDGDEQAVSYSGWKQNATGGVPVALVSIPHDLQYTEDNLSTNAAVATYKANIPLWGRVSAPATDDAKFSASLKWLTSYVRVRFDNANKMIDPVTTIKVQALKFKSGVSADDKTAAKAKKIADMKKQNVLTFQFATGGSKALANLLEADNTKYLNGWFEAELKDGGQMVNADDETESVAQPVANRNELVMDVEGQLEANQNYIYLPIISGVTYEALAITYVTEGGTEYIAGVYFDYTANRAEGKAIGIEYPNTSYILDGTTPAKVTKAIKENYDGTTNSVLYFNKADETTAASQFMTVSTGAASKNTIYLPEIKTKNLEIHITNITSQATKLDGADLTIADAAGVDNSAATGVVTLVIDKFQNPAAAQKVIVNSKAKVVLAGDFSNTNLTVENGDNCANLTLGTEATAFNYGARTYTATKGNLTVANMTNTGSVNYNNASGTLAVNSKLATVTVTDATSATIAAPVTTSVEALKNVTINVPYSATVADMTIKKLNIHKGVTAIKLDGGIIDEITAEGSSATTKVVATDNVTVTSTGLSAIRKNSWGSTGKISFTSSFAVPTKNTDPKFVNAFDATATTGFIYTGAQLAAIAQTTSTAGLAGNQTAFALKANITGLTNWTSPNLTKQFNGGKAATNGLTIKGVDAPLFGEVTAAISNVDLTVAINQNKNGIGGLAKNTAANAVTVQNVAIAGSIAAQNKVGGVFGYTGTGAVTFGDGAANSTNGVSVNVTFTDNTAYNNTVALINTAGTFGKFIGQAGSGAVTINKECTVGSAAFNKSALHFNYNRKLNASTGVIEWQFIGNGDLIGYSNNATSLTYGGITYSTAGTTDAEGDGKLAYDGTKKKVTGKFYYVGEYTELTAEIKTKIISCGGLGTVDSKADWSGVTVIAHNVFEAYAQ